MKKIAKNQFKKVDKFVRVDSTKVADSAGIFRCMCDCLKLFKKISGHEFTQEDL